MNAGRAPLAIFQLCIECRDVGSHRMFLVCARDISKCVTGEKGDYEMSPKFLKSLIFKSASIQSEIDVEQRRLRPNWKRLLRLKKMRLFIKDRIHQIALKNKQFSQYQAGEHFRSKSL